MSGSLLSRGLALLALSLSCGFCAPAKAPASAAPRAAVSPQALVGNWLFEMKVGGRSIEGSLHFSVAGGILAGSLTSSEGGERELKNLEIKDDRVSWDMEGPGGPEHATGTVEGSSMKGTMKRTAARRGEGGDRSAPPPAGGGMGRTGGGGRGGGRGRSGGRDSSEITWSAFKSVPPVETGAPSATPTPAAD